MIIGRDFDKIQFELFGLELLEPNAMVGDALIFCLAMYFAFRTRTIGFSEAFFTNWNRFFTVFGFSFLIGGLAHVFYNYWGVIGKLPNLILGLFATFYIEQAMLSIYDIGTWKKRLINMSKIKLGIALVAYAFQFYFVDLESDISKSLTITLINNALGLIFVLGYLGNRFGQSIDKGFNNFLLSVLVMVPILLIQVFKINLHPLFDRNDASHLLLMLTLVFYFKGVNAYGLKKVN